MSLHKFPFNKKASFTIEGVTSSYPQTDNCYRVNVTEHGQPYKKYQIEFMPKAQVDLGLKLQEMLTQTQIDELLPLLNALHEEGYQEASDNSAMDAAGEDL